MSKKRKFPVSQTEDTGIYNKRPRISQADGSDDSPNQNAQSRIDPTYGQRGAFPGLDGCSDNELFYGPASDGLEYLRMVRSEAKTVPNLLVAPSSSAISAQNEDLYRDYGQGFYSDGAYTAAPHPSSDLRHAPAHAGQQEEEDIDPQEAYYTSLCARFTALSQILQTTPPVTATSSTKPPRFYWTTRQWRMRTLRTTPTMALLAQLSHEMVIHGLTNLESTLTLKNLKAGNGKNVGAWAWGLLARCRDIGQMGSEEVGVLRDLGKKAVWLLRRIAAGEVGDEEGHDMGDEDAEEGGEEDEEEGEEGVQGVGKDEAEETIDQNGNDIADDGKNSLEEVAEPVENEEQLLAEARERMLSSLPPSSQAQDGVEPERSGGVEAETAAEQPIFTGSELSQLALHATLDMLVTIIGECYGQRDLLDRRLLWDEIDNLQ
ncbi:hypothetical protein P7C71_g3821, partial [Lecanoromycetidae sp. Uapishka_2]